MRSSGIVGVALGVAIAIGIAPRTARADERAANADDGLRPYTAATTLATDAVAISLFAYTRANRPLPLARSVLSGTPSEIAGGPYHGLYAGAEALWLLPSPMMHALAQDGAGRLLGSVALRLMPYVMVQLLEPAGGFVGFFDQHRDATAQDCGAIIFACHHVSQGARIGADVGFFVGALGATLADQLELWRAPRRRTTAPEPAAGGASIAPTLQLDGETRALGVEGTF